MECLYCNFEGVCDLYDPDGVNVDAGCDDEGFCTCNEDPDPSYSCSLYESDNVCNDCGADLNIEDCNCNWGKWGDFSK